MRRKTPEKLNCYSDTTNYPYIQAEFQNLKTINPELSLIVVSFAIKALEMIVAAVVLKIVLMIATIIKNFEKQTELLAEIVENQKSC